MEVHFIMTGVCVCVGGRGAKESLNTEKRDAVMRNTAEYRKVTV